MLTNINKQNVWNSNYKSKQGNIGLGRAIAFYTSKGIPIMIPLNDTQKYDLVIDIDGCGDFKRVSVKTTRTKYKTSKYYCVQLGNTGGSSGKSIIRKFDNKTCDIIFILTIDGDMYEIPSIEINTHRCLTLNNNWNKYKVYIN